MVKSYCNRRGNSSSDFGLTFVRYAELEFSTHNHAFTDIYFYNHHKLNITDIRIFKRHKFKDIANFYNAAYLVYFFNNKYFHLLYIGFPTDTIFTNNYCRSKTKQHFLAFRLRVYYTLLLYVH